MKRSSPNLHVGLLLLVSMISMASGPDVARARRSLPKQSFTWLPWAPESFARAKAEGKLILVDGTAVWCHWCHVMDETTYRDPSVGQLLAARFVTIRFDGDQRPDLAERYSDFGWPATIVLSADAEELGKYRGYLPPEELKRLLARVQEERTDVALEPTRGFESFPAPTGALGWLGAQVIHELDTSFYDEEQGGWGFRRKTPISANAEFEVRRLAHGDLTAKKRALFSLSQQGALIDPVWGGLSQYSAAQDWRAPHFEKLMTYQAAAIEAYARAFAVTADESMLARSKQLAHYLELFLTSPDGTFFTSQDADLNGGESNRPFLDGHAYYAKTDASRRALGVPAVDRHVYARENALAISALITLYEVTHERTFLDRARAAADGVMRTHLDAQGSVRHQAAGTEPLFLADAAALGRALVQLASATGEARYRLAAVEVARAVWRDFSDGAPGLFDTAVDPSATGAFARRQKSFVQNVSAGRFLALLGALVADPVWIERAQGLLASVSTPALLKAQGPWLGDYLLALDDANAVKWPPTEGGSKAHL